MTNFPDLSIIYCEQCGKEIKDKKNICWHHNKKGNRVYRHKECKNA